jgi:Rrf2 family transcriptional regulator, cysteine metabolism repressor
MKFRTPARYSLRLMLAIAKHGDDGRPIGLTAISRHTNLSRKYLEQLVAPLRKAGLLTSVSGRGGGYLLARDASEIFLEQVIDAAIGRIEVVDCVLDSDDCLHSEFCSCRHLWTLINSKITDVLQKFSIEDLLREDWPQLASSEMDTSYKSSNTQRNSNAEHNKSEVK